MNVPHWPAVSTLRLACPLLGGDVELTPSRARHILARHPELTEECLRVAETLAAPDSIHASAQDLSARLVVRWYDDLRRGKYVVVVVVHDVPSPRRWVVTAYISSDPVGGTTLWQRT